MSHQTIQLGRVIVVPQSYVESLASATCTGCITFSRVPTATQTKSTCFSIWTTNIRIGCAKFDSAISCPSPSTSWSVTFQSTISFGHVRGAAFHATNGSAIAMNSGHSGHISMASMTGSNAPTATLPSYWTISLSIDARTMDGYSAKSVTKSSLTRSRWRSTDDATRSASNASNYLARITILVTSATSTVFPSAPYLAVATFCSLRSSSSTLHYPTTRRKYALSALPERAFLAFHSTSARSTLT